MYQFLHIVKLYIKRYSFKDPMALLFLIIMPIIQLVLNLNIGSGDNDLIQNGYSLSASLNGAAVLAIFQMYCGTTIGDALHSDFSSDIRWRLQAAPISRKTFILAAGVGGWIYSLLTGILIIGLSYFVFDADWGNILISVVAFLIISIIAQIVGVIAFNLTKTGGAAIGMVITFGAIMHHAGVLRGINSSLDSMLDYLPQNLMMDIVRETGTFATGDIRISNHIIVLIVMMIIALGLAVITTKMKKSGGKNVDF